MERRDIYLREWKYENEKRVVSAQSEGEYCHSKKVCQSRDSISLWGHQVFSMKINMKHYWHSAGHWTRWSLQNTCASKTFRSHNNTSSVNWTNININININLLLLLTRVFFFFGIGYNRVKSWVSSETVIWNLLIITRLMRQTFQYNFMVKSCD